MSERDNGGPAFPNLKAHDGGPRDVRNGGMSLRDWFAGQALLPIIGLIGTPEDGPDDLWDASIAERAYALADAMIAARGKS